MESKTNARNDHCFKSGNNLGPTFWSEVPVGDGRGAR